MANHSVIGLGGTGGRIVRSFWKRIYENFRSEDPEGVNIRVEFGQRLADQATDALFYALNVRKQ